MEGKTAIFYCGNQGKYLGEIRVYEAEGAAQVKASIHYLNAQYPEDATMKAKVDQAVAEINNLGKRIAAQLATPPAGSAAAVESKPKTFLGAGACKECHESEYAVWAGSKHALAMQTLVEKQSDYNPECVKCHVVGFGKPGGFVDARSTAQLGERAVRSVPRAGGATRGGSHRGLRESGEGDLPRLPHQGPQPQFRLRDLLAPDQAPRMSPITGRILAIDPGRVRIGLALSDPSGMLASGLDTLISKGRRQDLEALVALAREREVAEIVVGCPRNMDGSSGNMTEFAERLAAELGEATGLPVRLWDERLSSAQAERALIQGDVRREDRREKRDRVAAILILQGYLDWRSTAESST